MKKVIHILKGWGKVFGFIPVSTAEAKLSELRLKICGVCEYSKESKALVLINGNANYEHELKCTKCKCPCLEKSLVVDERCPVGKW